MVILKKVYFLFVFFLSTFISSKSQSIENLNTFFDGEFMVITYDLSYPNPSQKFNISLFSSHNNYIAPITFITGDYGENVTPGKAKRAIWEVKKSLPADFDNLIIIKIKAAKMMSSTLLLNALSKHGYRRGKTLDLHWEGGKASDKIKIELFKNNVLLDKLAEGQENNRAYTWSIPKKLKGMGYSIRISNATDKSESESFRIKPRLPLLLKVAPVLVVGGAVALLVGSGGSSSSSDSESDLPGPVNPSN